MTTMMTPLFLHGHGDPCESEGGPVHLQGFMWNQHAEQPPSGTGRGFVSVVIDWGTRPLLAPPLSPVQWFAEVARHTRDTFRPNVQLKRRGGSVL